MHHELVLIDQSQLRQRQRELHASHEQSLTRLPLQLLNGLPQIPTHELRVPIDPVQGARHDVLLCRVDRPGEGFHPIGPRSRLRRRPERCLHHFVSHAAKEEGIGLLEFLDHVTIYFFVRGNCTMIAAPIQCDVDGCCDHRAISPDEDMDRHVVEKLEQADALLFGRVTYEMMEAAFRPPAQPGTRPDLMEPFARTIDAAKKYVVSSTLDRVDWNAELVRGDLGKAVQQLKRESGKGLLVGGVKLPLALAELGLIDEYEFVVHPRLAGHGPTLFAGLSKRIDLRLVSRQEFGSGAVAMRYEPRR